MIYGLLKFSSTSNNEPQELRAPNVFFKEEHPILYSDWVTGVPLSSWNLRFPLEKRQIFVDDLAEFLLQLWTTAAPPVLALSQDCRYSTWLTKSLDRGLRRALSGKAKWGDAINYLMMRSMIPDYWN